MNKWVYWSYYYLERESKEKKNIVFLNDNLDIDKLFKPPQKRNFIRIS
jgi:hypothetical protein